MGFDVIVLAPHHGGARQFEEMCGVRVYRFPYFYPKKYQDLCWGGGILPNMRRSNLAKIQLPLLFIAEMYHTLRIIKKEDIDLIHAHWILPQGMIGAIYKKLYKIPLVVSLHGVGDMFPLKYLKSLGKFTLDSCDFCTVNSPATKKAVLELEVQNIKQKIEKIPMGVDIERFTPKKSRRDSDFTKGGAFTKDSLIILFIGRLIMEKGVKYLIGAMPVVLKEHPTARLIIVGEGPEKNDLMQLSKKLDVDKNISFKGELPNDELPGLYRNSDIFVLPSIVNKAGDTEGLGVVLLEAMASKVPVIGSNVGGIPEVIKDGKTGMLVAEKSGDEAKILREQTRKLTRKIEMKTGWFRPEFTYVPEEK